MSTALISGCEIEQKEIKGNGNITTNRRFVESFSELEINGIFTVYLSQASMTKVEVVTDENLQQLINTETNNNVLSIVNNSEDDFSANRMDIYITVPDIKRIKLDGVNSFYCLDTLQLDEVYIEKENTGFMQFNAVLNKLTIHSSDVGDLELNGKSLDLEITNEMTGNIYGYGFKTNNLVLSHTGTGDIQVFVTNSIKADLSGVGDVYCKGFPANISKTTNGVCRLYVGN